MQFLLAAYDPAHESADGKYWVRWHSDLPAELADGFYYEFAAKNLPKNPNKLSQTDFVGGWAAVNDTWACLYRFLDGGRDLRGRPGRFVLVCAFYRRRDNANIDPFSVIQSIPFQKLSNDAALSRPLRLPDSFEFNPELPEIALLGNHSLGGSSTEPIEYTGTDAAEKAAYAYANLRRGCRFHCVIDCRNGEKKITVESVPPSSKPEVNAQEVSSDRTHKEMMNDRTADKGERRPKAVACIDNNERVPSHFISAAIPLWARVLVLLVGLVLAAAIVWKAQKRIPAGPAEGRTLQGQPPATKPAGSTVTVRKR